MPRPPTPSLCTVAALLVLVSCVPGRQPPPASPPPALGPLTPRVISQASPIASCNGNGQLVDVPEEPSLAADPRDPRHLIATWQQDRRSAGGAFGLAVALSRDGGGTWRESMLPSLAQCAGGPYELVSDPWTSVGADGSAYVGALGLNPNGKPGSAILVSAARDGGSSWGAPVVVAAADPRTELLDKPSILADPRRSRRVYAVWAKFTAGSRSNDIGFSRSDDGGATWRQPVSVFKGGGASQNNLLLALPDGRLVDMFVEGGEAREGDLIRVAAAYSVDGGETWSQPVTVASFTFTITRDPDRGTAIRSIGQDISAAASGGRLYVTWFENHRNGTSTIWVSSSADGGRTWAQPSSLVQEAVQPFLPAIAVARDGRLGATWYDLRNATLGPGLGTEVWSAVSADRGVTWRSKRLDGPFDLRTAPNSTLGLFIGDYEGLVGLQSSFAAAYVRTPAGAQQPRTEIAFARFG